MNTLKLYEEYINSGSNRITTLLKNLVQSLESSFSGSNKSLGVKDLETLALIDISQSNVNDAFEKNILMRFSDNSYQYQMTFVIKLEDVKDNDPINKGYMKLKIYNGGDGQLVREWQKDLSLYESSDEDMNQEGRWFLKVGEIETQEGQAQEGQAQEGQAQEGQAQVDQSSLDFIEHFILDKLSFLKEMVDKQNGGEEGPELQLENDTE